MDSYGLSLPDIVEALEKNNTNVGAGYIERNGEQYLIRAPGQVRSVQDIGDIIVGTAQGERPIRIRDVAQVELGRELRTGAATENGRAVVLGTFLMLIGDNRRAVSLTGGEKMQAINRPMRRQEEPRDGQEIVRPVQPR